PPPEPSAGRYSRPTSRVGNFDEHHWGIFLSPVTIAKNPDAHIGRKVVVYGWVSQFDSATGTDAFRAETSGEQMGASYEYDTNTVIQEGTPGLFSEVVENDLVTMYVEVAGSMSYDTTMGGSTTVPKVDAYIIEVTGSD
ncbi:MAG: serine/threonine protein kinase, partial [Gordonia sp. (in: high G+C Gram-positive bacteria)]